MSELVEEMRQQLAGYLAEHDKRQSKAAREMRVSTTTLSQFLSGTYPAITRKSHGRPSSSSPWMKPARNYAAPPVCAWP